MLELLAVAAAGVSNSLAGAGSLITFPTLLALGLPPVAANVTSTVGLVPGAAGGAIGYPDLLTEQRERLTRLALPTLIGAAGGTALLLVTSNDTFEAIVPALVAGCCLLLLFQPRLTARIAHAGDERSPLLTAGLIFSGGYAAYFGSAVGILLLGLLASSSPTRCSTSTRSRSCSPASPTCSPRSPTPSSPRSTGATPSA